MDHNSVKQDDKRNGSFHFLFSLCRADLEEHKKQLLKPWLYFLNQKWKLKSNKTLIDPGLTTPKVWWFLKMSASFISVTDLKFRGFSATYNFSATVIRHKFQITHVSKKKKSKNKEF